MDVGAVPWHYRETTIAVTHTDFLWKTRRRADTAEYDLLLLSCRLGPKSGTEEDVGSWAYLAAGFLGIKEN